MKSNGSKECDKHPYMRVAFWMDPKNHFWEWHPNLSESGRQYYRDWLNRLVSREKNLAVIDPKLK